jgi:hypothetical protein
MNKEEFEAAVSKKKAEIEEQLEEELKNNAELRKVFEKNPEKKDLYIQKILDSSPIVENEPSKSEMKQFQINPAWCKKCLFSHGEPPFEDAPEKKWCEIYRYNNGEQKPHEVYFEGAECEFYEKA